MKFLMLLTYVSGMVFVVAFGVKLLKYATMPMHVRWEIYPVPHEGKDYGGSFYEEVDHWTKVRHKDHWAQLAFMVPEILFIRGLYHDNKPLWYVSFPFHLGLYLCIGGLALLALNAVLQLLGFAPKGALVSLVQAMTMVLGVAGFISGAIGSLGLIVRRLTDPVLKENSAGIDFMNLVWLAAIFVTGFLVWLRDPGFDTSVQYLISLLSFKAMASPEKMTGMHVLNLLLFIGFWAYFPFTHMTHMVSKYFMWDKVKWDDTQNIDNPSMDAKIKTYLGYPVTWSAPHVGAEGGTKTWGDVATSNPWSGEAKK